MCDSWSHDTTISDEMRAAVWRELSLLHLRSVQRESTRKFKKKISIQRQSLTEKAVEKIWRCQQVKCISTFSENER